MDELDNTGSLNRRIAEQTFGAGRPMPGFVDPLFQFHRLNVQGVRKAERVAEAFSELLSELSDQCGVAGEPAKSREFSIVRTKLEEACFFAKKALAVLPENQEL